MTDDDPIDTIFEMQRQTLEQSQEALEQSIEFQQQLNDAIKSGMSATARIEPVQQEPQLIVPSSAVTTRGGKQVVFIAREGAAVMQPVETGRIEGNLTAVRTGLEGGETLIISGLSGLSEEDPVNPTVLGESGDWQ